MLPNRHFKQFCLWVKGFDAHFDAVSLGFVQIGDNGAVTYDIQRLVRAVALFVFEADARGYGQVFLQQATLRFLCIRHRTKAVNGQQGVPDEHAVANLHGVGSAAHPAFFIGFGR